jgi:hypothetical protein
MCAHSKLELLAQVAMQSLLLPRDDAMPVHKLEDAPIADLIETIQHMCNNLARHDWAEEKPLEYTA